mmetsp:Transcript_32103/g.89883  ORF Transcript_32103/g.89883 Transcript_32103/m.89883 type:complete len:315 (+) Transcript_32103:16-960(+)
MKGYWRLLLLVGVALLLPGPGRLGSVTPGSKANRFDENIMEPSSARTSAYSYYIIPAADDPGQGGTPNVKFQLAVPNLRDATTGRLTILRSPVDHFHVYGPSVKEHKRCHGGKRAVVTDQALTNGCLSATNLSPFSYDADALCEGPLVSDGTIITEGVAAPRPRNDCIGIFKREVGGHFIIGNALAISRSGYLPQLQQLGCGFGLLVVNGTALYSMSSLIAPRTVLGVDSSGALVTLVAEGSETANTGLTLNQTAAWAASEDGLHLEWAVNFDGGGSSTMFWAPNGPDVPQGCPTGNDNPVCTQRQVATISCIG